MAIDFTSVCFIIFSLISRGYQLAFIVSFSHRMGNYFTEILRNTCDISLYKSLTCSIRSRGDDLVVI